MVLGKSPSKVGSIIVEPEIQFDTNITRYKIKVFLSLHCKCSNFYLLVNGKDSNGSTCQ